MKGLRIIFIIPSVIASLLISGALFAQSSEKLVVAIPDFNIGEGLPSSYKNLAETLKAALDKSGRINTSGENEIKIKIEQMKLNQAAGSDCRMDEKCMLRIGEDLQVDYIAYSNISHIGKNYQITVKLMKIKAGRDIRSVSRTVSSENELSDAVNKIGEMLSFQFSLEGRIKEIISEGDAVAIDLGSSNFLKEGDVFNVERGKRKIDRIQIGRIRIQRIDTNECKAEILKEKKKFMVGDIVILDEEELLKRLEKDRKDEQERLEKDKEYAAKMKEKEMERRKSSSGDGVGWEASLKKRAPLFRFGMGSAEMMDSKLKNNVTNGKFMKFDWFLWRERDYTGDGFDFFLSGVKKIYLPEGNVAHKTDINMTGFDVGVRYVYGAYIFFEYFSAYLSGAFRYLNTIETGNNTQSEFKSKGFIGAVGLEMTMISYIGFFVEAGMGYTPVGKSKANVEGLQYLFGVTLRTGYN